jgi:hypothetical protein
MCVAPHATRIAPQESLQYPAFRQIDEAEDISVVGSYGSIEFEFGEDVVQLIIQASPPHDSAAPRTINSRRLLLAFLAVPEPWRAWTAAVGLRPDLLVTAPADAGRRRRGARWSLRGDSVPFSDDAQRVIEDAAQDAARRGSQQVNLGHMLLALLARPEVTEMFRSEVDVEALRDSVAGGFPPTDQRN